MHVHKIKWFCWFTTIVSLMALVLVIQWILRPIESVGESNSKQVSKGSNETIEGDLNYPTQQQLKQLATLSLQRPIFDPPPPEIIKPKPKPPARLQAKLTGIIHEKDQSMALFMTKDNQTKLFSIGDKFADASGQVELLAIEPQSVLIKYAGKTQLLKLPGEAKR